MTPNLLILSHATYVGASGATAAATYSFFTKDYQPPAAARHIDYDVVHNQNGKFKYVYDNGPGFVRWAPFRVACERTFASFLNANAATQYAHLREMWFYTGQLGMEIAGEVYEVHWAQDPVEPAFKVFPVQVNDEIEREVVIQLEEA